LNLFPLYDLPGMFQKENKDAQRLLG